MSDTASRLGLESLEPDDDGICEIISEEADIVLIDCTEADGTVLVTAKLMDAPSGESDALTAALKANHRFVATKGATISIDPDDGSFALSLYRPVAALDGEKMVSLLEEFTATLLSLRKTLA